MERHIEFTEWAVAQGVKLNGIAAHKFPGRGLGVIAEKRIVVRGISLLVMFLLHCRVFHISCCDLTRHFPSQKLHASHSDLSDLTSKFLSKPSKTLYQ